MSDMRWGRDSEEDVPVVLPSEGPYWDITAEEVSSESLVYRDITGECVSSVSAVPLRTLRTGGDTEPEYRSRGEKAVVSTAEYSL